MDNYIIIANILFQIVEQKKKKFETETKNDEKMDLQKTKAMNFCGIYSICLVQRWNTKTTLKKRKGREFSSVYKLSANG